MILLTNVAGTAPDKIQLTVSAAAPVDVHASGVDFDGTDVTPWRQNTAFTIAETKDIVAAPASGVTRNIQTLHIRNKSASTSVSVTVIYDQNGTDFELHKVGLFAGEALEYVEGVGFFLIRSEASILQVKAATSDQSTSSTTLSEVTGLSLTTGIGVFHFRYKILYQAAVATTGIRFSVNHTGTVTAFVANRLFGGTSGLNSDAAPDQNQVLAAAAVYNVFAARAKSTTGWGTTISVDTADADMLEIIEGLCIVTVDGDLELWHGSEVAAQTTVKAGSSVVVTRVGD